MDKVKEREGEGHALISLLQDHEDRNDRCRHYEGQGGLPEIHVRIDYHQSELNKVRFKVIIAQLSDVSCVQIMLYSKPLNFLKKLIVAYPDLMAYA
jgi:hypothetical protein